MGRIKGWKKKEFQKLPFWTKIAKGTLQEVAIYKDFITTDPGLNKDGSTSIKKMKGYYVYSTRLARGPYPGKYKFTWLIKKSTKQKAIDKAIQYMRSQ
jgi:hypothetical protein